MTEAGRERYHQLADQIGKSVSRSPIDRAGINRAAKELAALSRQEGPRKPASKDQIKDLVTGIQIKDPSITVFSEESKPKSHMEELRAGIVGKSIPDALSWLRESRGVDTKELADRIAAEPNNGIYRTLNAISITNLEQGTRIPQKHELARIVQAMDIDRNDRSGREIQDMLEKTAYTIRKVQNYRRR